MNLTHSLLLVLGLAMGHSTAASAASCPCFTASDVDGVEEFREEEAQGSHFDIHTFYGVIPAKGIRYSTTKSDNQGFQSYRCDVATGNLNAECRDSLAPNPLCRRLDINQEEHIACHDLLRDATQPTEEELPCTVPVSVEELRAFDASIDSSTISLQNARTGKYLTLAEDGSIVTQELAGGPSLLAHQWAFIRDECPDLVTSAAKGTTRTCFRLESKENRDITLSTNGALAFALPPGPPYGVLSVYIVEPTECYSANDSFTARLQVAYTGDRYVADIPVHLDHLTVLELAVRSDRDIADEAEWIIATQPSEQELPSTVPVSVDCPCFTASDVEGSVEEFRDEVVQEDGRFVISTFYELMLAKGTRYSTTKSDNQGFQSFRCVVDTGNQNAECRDTLVSIPLCRRLDINQQEHIACRDLLREATQPSEEELPCTAPVSVEELRAFDASIDSSTISLQNARTGKYLILAEDGSIGTQELAGGPSSLAHQWAFIRDECPDLVTTRTCFRLASKENQDITLITNGVLAFALPPGPPFFIPTVYIVEPTQCYSTNDSLTARLQVAYIGDRYVADIPVPWDPHLTTLELAVSAADGAEWIIDHV